MRRFFKKLTLALTLIGLASPAFAVPVLRQNIVVNAAIVTIGDMFDNAGNLAEQALFLAPAPGTTGQVNIAAIRTATGKAGLSKFENPGFSNVSVARSGIAIKSSDINELIAQDLREQGILRNGMSVTTQLNQRLGTLYAARSGPPLKLEQLIYTPGNTGFSARFTLAGRNQALEISGRLSFMVQTPHLTRTLPAGAIIKPTDVEMRAVTLQFANSAQLPMLNQVVGQQLRRQMRRGVAVRLNDITMPTLISRNEIVTIYLKSGAMTLTVKGQALADASRGQAVSVLNLLSKTVIQGIAVNPGTVEIRSGSNQLAAL
ncbi:hypothetical protein MNBD_ALPHA12-1466 [hydrothermal vent metagenome]|uniref:SAF domain-containing protein n=1 Tax=hydrothermal vent metagenome TaxID=652676 RepID=A0A3B0UED3_9ZZZZ